MLCSLVGDINVSNTFSQTSRFFVVFCLTLFSVSYNGYSLILTGLYQLVTSFLPTAGSAVLRTRYVVDEIDR